MKFIVAMDSRRFGGHHGQQWSKFVHESLFVWMGDVTRSLQHNHSLKRPITRIVDESWNELFVKWALMKIQCWNSDFVGVIAGTSWWIHRYKRGNEPTRPSNNKENDNKPNEQSNDLRSGVHHNHLNLEQPTAFSQVHDSFSGGNVRSGGHVRWISSRRNEESVHEIPGFPRHILTENVNRNRTMNSIIECHRDARKNRRREWTEVRKGPNLDFYFLCTECGTAILLVGHSDGCEPKLVINISVVCDFRCHNISLTIKYVIKHFVRKWNLNRRIDILSECEKAE
jgi:hypothetical protein